MSKKLKYKIISCSSEQNEYPVSSLLFGGQNGGWQTKRFCTYPQQVTFEFYGVVKLDKIQIVSDNRKIPSQVDILYFLPLSGRQSEQRFIKYGYLNFNKNQNSQLKQQKSIMVDIRCLYLRFLFHKPHLSKENFFSQIGIQQIVIYGNDNNGLLIPVEKGNTRQIGNLVGIDRQVIEDDPYISEKINYLNGLKEKAVNDEDFQQANFLKTMLEQIRQLGEQLKKLQIEKHQAIENEDYQKANNVKKSIQKHKKQIDSLISFQNDDMVIQQQQMSNQNNNIINNNNNLNDFQDNEFVDPEMSEMIQKSGMNKQSPNNSRVISNSRAKINRSMVKKDKNVTENYDQRVIPTLAGGAGNKVKTQEQQFEDKDQEKKVQLHPEQIDGKYIQFSLILQQHFSQDTVKCFFSQHWQLKVQALTTILQQIKKKQNSDAGFIKCLIVVVKNSLSQTNFQVALNSLQVLGELLKNNAKGNYLSRTNQVNNDLDAISKQNVKRLSDNNNKLKQQAEKVFGDMVSSTLYGPEACAVALVKSKQKTAKLSAKQIMTRLVELQKLVQSNGTNPIINIALEFGVEHCKNPASEVRNQALGLLIACKNKNPQEIQKKLKEQKNILELIEIVQNKSTSKTQKIKKKK